MNTRGIVLGLFSAALIFFWQCANNPTEPETPGANEIWFQGGAVTPSTRTVNRGATVVWINKDTESHAVDSGAPGNPTGIFQSNNLSAGQSFSHPFNTTGVFPYYCLRHLNRASERGTVTVQ